MEQMKRARENEARFRELKGKSSVWSHGRDDSRPCAGQRGSLLRRGQCVASLRRTVRVSPQAEYAGILRTDRKQEGRDRRVEPRNIQGAAVERAV